MKKPVRICVTCKDPLKNQRFSHTSSKEGKWNRWGGVSRWCDGPQKTPGAKSYGPRSPIHFRDFAGPGTTVCGLAGGRTRGKYPDKSADVTWSRIKVDLTQTTCPSCLLVIIQRCKKALQKLALAQPQLRQLVREARGRVILTALKEMVHS